ncbi:hypothetical protein H6P81_005863 [Aristolochia fimbriata]|uniref:TF-B3 domain-containing protein n=1 Tax=Aristolochia fimbriata TaxID=158543 RepID=A0AAV7EWT8_ARIFI|nr:hypothetical protein H6P81_005863 [Aristolochia fimbriata]
MEPFNLNSPPPATEISDPATEVASRTVTVEEGGGEQMSRSDTARELVTADFLDAASVRANRKKRMARQRRSVGSIFPLPPLLPKLVIHSPPPVPRIMQDTHFRFLLQKELQNSDVSSLGRMVLPKKEAEAHLPTLSARDGITITMEDMETAYVWNFKYRYWPNNKSRMYVLEHIGEFIKTHGLCCGDVILIFKDDHAQQYLIQARKVVNRMPCNIFPARKMMDHMSLSGEMTDHAYSTRRATSLITPSRKMSDHASSSRKMKQYVRSSTKKSSTSKVTAAANATPLITTFNEQAIPDAQANQLTFLHATDDSFSGILDDAFAADTPFDFSNSTSGSSPWLATSPCIGPDDNMSFDDFL